MPPTSLANFNPFKHVIITMTEVDIYMSPCLGNAKKKDDNRHIYIFFIYSNYILHPYGSSNYNTKACKHIQCIYISYVVTLARGSIHIF